MRSNAIHRYFASRDKWWRLHAYLVYVRSLLEYNSAVWSPHLKQDIAVIQKVQRLWKVDIVSYPDRLHHLGISSMELCRLYFDLTYCYNIVFGLVHVHLMTSLSHVLYIAYKRTFLQSV